MTDSIRVQILSDLHTEFGPHAIPRPEELATDADIVIVAGDLAAAPDTAHVAARLFPTAPVLILIGGNHEHYRTDRTIDEGLEEVRREARYISTLEGRWMGVLEDGLILTRVRDTTVRILGATLWTDYDLRSQPDLDAAICDTSINDHRLIRGRDGGFFTTREATERHHHSGEFLARELDHAHDGPTIVVTHHLPSMRSVAERFRGDPTSSAFASNADDLVAMGATLWVHGHTHDSCAWRDGNGTLVVCNPAGYANPDGSRENRQFSPRLCVSLEKHGDLWHADMPLCDCADTKTDSQ